MREIDPATTVLVTDIAAGNAGTMFDQGTPTLPAFVDLANICQAAVMNDALLASPIAVENNALLQDLDNVVTLAPQSDPDTERAAPGEQNCLPEVTLEQLKTELPDSVDDPIVNVWLQSLRIRLFDDNFGGMVSPAVLGSEVDRGLQLVRKLPLAMLMLQASEGEGDFASGEARDTFLNWAKPALARFDQYAAALTHLYREIGVDNVTSVLEQTFVDAKRVDVGFGDGDLKTIRAEVENRIDIGVAQFRCLALEQYNLPAVGLHVLAAANGKEDLAKTIDRFREDHQKLRGTIARLEKERWQALRDREAGLRDLARLRANLDHAFKAFNEDIRDPYLDKDIDQARVLINGAKLVDKLVGILRSMGGDLLELGEWLKLFRVENRLDQSVVPGLFKAAGVIKNLQIATVSSVAGRYLHLDDEQMASPRFMLYAHTRRVEASVGLADWSDEPGITIDDGEYIPVSKLWSSMLMEMGEGKTTLADGLLAGKATD